MPDQITVKQDPNAKSFTPCPEGSQHAVCADVIDLGWTTDQYQQEDVRIIHKMALVFQTAEPSEQGKPFEPSIEFTIGQEFEDGHQVTTFGERSKIRQFLANWRGKPYTKEEAEAGAPLHKLVGVNAILNVQHKTSKKDRTYAVIAGVTPPLKGLAKLAISADYVRSDHWARRKEEYAAKLAEYRAATKETLGAWNAPQPLDEMPAALQDDDDSLPF